MSTNRRKHLNAPRALFLGLAMAAVTGVLVVGLRGQVSAWLARYWQSRLDEASDDQAQMLLAGVARLDVPGIPVLVAACGSPRESVARAARTRLQEELGYWESLSPKQASRRLAVLAESLAREVDQFGPTARRDAAELATRILHWPLDSAAVDRGRVVASCEEVFRATTPDRVLLAQRRRSNGATYLALGGDRPSVEPAPWIAEDRSSDENAPAGNATAEGPKPEHGTPEPSVIIRLPHVSADGSGQSPAVEIAIAGSPGAPAPAASGLQQPERFSPRRESPSASSGRSFPNRGASLPHAASAKSSAKIGDQWHPPDGFAAADPLEHALEEIETVQLMRRLHDSDPRMAMRAETELTRRGFSARHVELARQLFHPDVEVRKQLARELPGMTGVNAVPWLVQLSRDRDPQVRVAAITLMATTGEPSLLDEIEQIAAADPNPRVRLQAKRVAEHRRPRTY